MQRVGFRLQVRPEMVDEYVRRHEQVWSDMLQALRDTSSWVLFSLLFSVLTVSFFFGNVLRTVAKVTAGH